MPEELLDRLAAEVHAMYSAGDGLALRNLRTGTEITISPQAIWMLVACLQLSLRHPGNDGITAENMSKLLGWFREQFIQPGSAMEEVFLAGEGKRS